MQPILGKRYLPVLEAANYIGLAKSTLDKDRVTRTLGLPYIRCGRRVMYDVVELDKWMAARASDAPAQ